MGMLDGKVAVVTGAGGGIGRATAIAIAANGGKVVVNDIGATVTGEGHDAGPAQRVVQEIEQAHGKGMAVANSGSVSSWEDAQRMVQDAIDHFGRIDIVVDCPISGGPKGARAGTLTVIVSGPEAAKKELRPWLQRIGRNVFDVGEKPGQAQLMKLVNNLINAANMATAFEALVLGAKGGLDPDQMVDILNVSTGQNSATLTKVPKSVLPGTFDYGSSLTIMLKDVVLGLQEAEALGVPMWVHGTVGQLWRFAEQQGLGPADFTSLIKVMEGWAGVEVRSRRS